MYTLLHILSISLMLSATQVQAQHKHTEPISASSKVTMQTDDLFQVQLSNVFRASQLLKDVLIASDTKKVQQAAATVKKALSQVDMHLLSGKAHTDGIQLQKQLNSSLGQIESENKLKAQRQAFASFSQALYKSIKTFGISGEKAYYQFCPMALEGEGAYWLSNSQPIKNPYLGDNMLTCGSTKEVIQ